MNWYLAKLVYRVIYGDGLYQAEFNEQWRLVEASDEVHAFTKAQLLGHREESALCNETETLLQWKFIDVCELIVLGDKTDGAEILSHNHMPKDATAYVKSIRRQSSQLLAESCNKCFYEN